MHVHPMDAMSDASSGVPAEHLLVDRRGFLLGSLATLTGVSLAHLNEALAGSGPTAQLPKQTKAFLEILSDTLIPTTDTPGALQAGTPAFVERFLARFLEPRDFADLPAQLELLQQELARRGGPFEMLPAAQRTAVLAAFDQEVTGQPVPAKGSVGELYVRIRAMTVLGYYTSEIGMTQELTYLPVPGRYDGDVPFDPKARGVSNAG